MQTYTHINNIYITAAVSALVLAIGLAFPASAQIPGVSTLPVSIEMSPRNPSPGEQISFRVQSFSLDLNRAVIAWELDNTLVARGTGLTEVVLEAGKLGQEQILSVTATTDSGSFSEEITIRPTFIDLIWESPGSYTPPLYPGKALPSHEAPFRVVAIASLKNAGGALLGPDEMTFTWSQDGRTLGNKSGVGKNVLNIDEPFPFRDIVIGVTVESLDGRLRGAHAVSISPTVPNLIFYHKHPLLGVLFNSTLAATAEIESDEVTVQAHPFFATAPMRAEPLLSYTWSVNSEKVQNPGNNKSELTLRRTDQNVGQVRVGVSLEHVERSFQRGTTGATLQFSGERSAFSNNNDE